MPCLLSIVANYLRKWCAMIKCLITCIDFREKYISSLGDGDVFEVFDYVIDVTKLIFPERGSFKFNDGVVGNNIYTPKNKSEFCNIVKKVKADLYLIFRPQEYSVTKFVYEIVSKSGATWGVLSNKKTLRNPLDIISVRKNIKKILYKVAPGKDFKSDFLMTNSLVANSDILRKIKFNEVIKVPHMDAVTPAQMSKEMSKGMCKNKKRVGVFLDQYLPFHLEIQKKRGVYIDPVVYYKELEKVLGFLKIEHGLDEIVFCRHPNSLGEELKYIGRLRSVQGDTKLEVVKSDVVFVHFSNSASFAIQANKKIVCLCLGCMPKSLQRTIEEKGKDLGVDVVYYTEEGGVEVKQRWKGNALLRRFLFSVFYSQYKKSPLEVIGNTQ